uniref:HMA domain-containing protein n=1 Tax=Aegilops tauschii subsp. strangulata TaxID=200361 RepID=A0A453KIU4_AEGTS
MNSAGVTSATLEGDKIIIVGDGVDPIALTTMLRRSLGKAELVSISSGDDKKKDGGYGYGYGGEKKKDGYGYGGSDGGGGKDSKGNGGYHQNEVAPIPYPAYHQYNAMPSCPAYAYAPYQQQQQDPGCSIM